MYKGAVNEMCLDIIVVVVVILGVSVRFANKSFLGFGREQYSSSAAAEMRLVFGTKNYRKLSIFTSNRA